MTHPNTLPSSVTETSETDSDRVSECPMCGQREFLRVIQSPPLEPEAEPWGFHVICSARGLYTVGHKPTHPVGCGTAGGWGETIAEAVAAWNRRTTPSLPPRSGGVVVKGLEWDHPTKWAANAMALGLIYMADSGLGDDKWKASRGGYYPGRIGDAYATLDEAKAAAQADYEARIRSTLADPIPEAPADEEVGGPDVGLARDEWLAAASSPQIERWALKWADVLLDALRRSTKTDKPGVREAANLVTVNAGLYNQGRADAFEKAAALCDKLAVTAEKTGEQFGAASPARDQHFARKGAFLEIAFAIRALSASTVTEEQPKGGHCVHKKQPGGCQLHNLHCGWPDCDTLPRSTAGGAK